MRQVMRHVMLLHALASTYLGVLSYPFLGTFTNVGIGARIDANGRLSDSLFPLTLTSP